MENSVKNHKNFVIKTEEGIEKGIFFRSPIQLVDFDAYYGNEDDPFNAWDYLERIKNPLIKLFEILKGNSNIINNIKKWSEEDNWAGFQANILCSPVYFERKYRKLEAESTSEDTNIQSVKSYGYESQYNRCGGACDIEKSVFTLKNNKKIKVNTLDSFNYTYQFKIEKIIDSDNVSITATI